VKSSPISGDDLTGEMAAFDRPGAAREREGFIVVVQKGALERPGAILAAAKRGKWIIA
jgi:hypothetical protein